VGDGDGKDKLATAQPVGAAIYQAGAIDDGKDRYEDKDGDSAKQALYDASDFHQLVHKIANKNYEFSFLKYAIPIEFKNMGDGKPPLLRYSLRQVHAKQSFCNNIAVSLKKIHPEFQVIYEKESQMLAKDAESYQEKYTQKQRQEVEKLKQSAIVREIFKQFPNAEFING
jgi:hypothetical protein